MTARQRSLDQRRWVEHEHAQCEMTVQQKGPHWGLYCAQHGTWIKWISQRDVAKIVDLVEQGKYNSNAY